MSEGTNDIIGNHDLQWNRNAEQMLARWCDQSKCFEWMHAECYAEFAKKAQRLMITIIVLGSFSGLSNVIAGNYEYDGFKMSYLFGSISIFVGMLSVLQDKLAYQTKANDFLQYSNEWSIIRLNIEEEINLPVSSRQNCGTFLKFIRKSINQVYLNGTPKILSHIKQKCYNKFKDIKDFDVPDACGSIEHSLVYNENLEQNMNLTTERKYSHQNSIQSNKHNIHSVVIPMTINDCEEEDHNEKTPLIK